MSAFEIVPAVPVAFGRVVGKHDAAGQWGTAGKNPLALAWHWMSQGAQRIHFEEMGSSPPGSMIQTTPALVLGCRLGRSRIQVGGGIRDGRTARLLTSQGADTLVLRRTLWDPKKLQEIIAQANPQHVMVTVSLDDSDDVGVEQGLKLARGLGVDKVLLVGSWRAPVIFPFQKEAIMRLKAQSFEIWVAGGIRYDTTVQALKALGIRGVIIGQAFYQGQLSFAELNHLASA